MSDITYAPLLRHCCAVTIRLLPERLIGYFEWPRHATILTLEIHTIAITSRGVMGAGARNIVTTLSTHTTGYTIQYMNIRYACMGHHCHTAADTWRSIRLRCYAPRFHCHETYHYIVTSYATPHLRHCHITAMLTASPILRHGDTLRIVDIHDMRCAPCCYATTISADAIPFASCRQRNIIVDTIMPR